MRTPEYELPLPRAWVPDALVALGLPLAVVSLFFPWAPVICGDGYCVFNWKPLTPPGSTNLGLIFAVACLAAGTSLGMSVFLRMSWRENSRYSNWIVAGSGVAMMAVMVRIYYRTRAELGCPRGAMCPLSYPVSPGPVLFSWPWYLALVGSLAIAVGAYLKVDAEFRITAKALALVLALAYGISYGARKSARYVVPGA